MSYLAGRRVPDETPPHLLEPGDYGKWRGGWVCCCPGDSCARGNLDGHTIVEHPEGTITVEPSILVTAGTEQLFHGYLRNGVWSGC